MRTVAAHGRKPRSGTRCTQLTVTACFKSKPWVERRCTSFALRRIVRIDAGSGLHPAWHCLRHAKPGCGWLLIVSGRLTIGTLQGRRAVGLLAILLMLHGVTCGRINWPVIRWRKPAIAIAAIGLLLRKIRLLNIGWLIRLLLARLLKSTRCRSERRSGGSQLRRCDSWLNIGLCWLHLNGRWRWWRCKCALQHSRSNSWARVFFCKTEFWLRACRNLARWRRRIRWRSGWDGQLGLLGPLLGNLDALLGKFF